MKIVKISGLTGSGKTLVLDSLSASLTAPVLEAATLRRDLEAGRTPPLRKTWLIDEVQHAGCGITHILLLLEKVYASEADSFYVFYTDEDYL